MIDARRPQGVPRGRESLAQWTSPRAPSCGRSREKEVLIPTGQGRLADRGQGRGPSPSSPPGTSVERLLQPRVVANAVGVVVGAGGAAMLLPMLFSLLAGDGQALAFAGPALAALVTGGLLFFPARSRRGSRGSTYVSGRDVYLIVVLGWLGVAAFGSAPFVLSGLMGPTDAFFESCRLRQRGHRRSDGRERGALPAAVAQHLAVGRGHRIVRLFVAVAPLVGFGATQLYSAEAAHPVPGGSPRAPGHGQIPRLRLPRPDARGVVALSLPGCAFSMRQSPLTTVSTGGFSTRADSIAAFDSTAIEFFWRPA